MKKSNLLVAALLIAGFSACKKITEPVPLGTATVKGKIVADLDISNDMNTSGGFEEGSVPEAVAGMRIYATINYFYLDQTPNGGTSDYKEEVVETTTDSEGAYSLQLPAGDKPFNVTVKFESFDADRTLADEFGNSIGTALYNFSTTDRTVNVYDGATIDLDQIKLGASALNTNEPQANGTAKVSGTITMDHIVLPGDTGQNGLDSTIYEFAPSGTKLTFRINSNILGDNFYDYFTTTVGSNGVYSIDLPTKPGPAGQVTFQIFFPDLLINYSDTRTDPNVVEQRVFTASHTAQTITNEDILIDLDFEYQD